MNIKQLKALADEQGVTVDELIKEMEVGGTVTKPYIVAVSFDRLSDLLAFAKRISESGVAVYKSDALDREFPNRAGGNRYVIRTVGGHHGKPESWRVDSDLFEADDEDEA